MILLLEIILWVLCSSKEDIVQSLVWSPLLGIFLPSFNHQNVVEALDAVYHCRNRTIFQAFPHTHTQKNNFSIETTKCIEQLLFNITQFICQSFQSQDMLITFRPLSLLECGSPGAVIFVGFIFLNTQYNPRYIPEQCRHMQVLNKYV